MGKNIVICCDGTGNTFAHSSTNVTYLIRYLALDDHTTQAAVYHQGVGTGEQHLADVRAYRADLPDRLALHIPSRPRPSRFPGKEQLDLARGLLFGYGLAGDVGTMYKQLSCLYSGPADRVFLFGFSRGAFAVRALAGLLYRFGLPTADCPDFDSRFAQAWGLFAPHEPTPQEQDAIQRLRSSQQECTVHFLGIWDTVKSYGGLIPISLPHLRHNPVVRHVRHALALHERRAWFKPTTWGHLDRDQAGALLRVDERSPSDWAEQDIDEVWFVGCHSDVGGDEDARPTADIALRWMLGEAVHVPEGLRLSEQGHTFLGGTDSEPSVHESQNVRWRLAACIPRREIDNFDLYPRKRWGWGNDGGRDPSTLRRDGTVRVHASAVGLHSVPEPIEVRHTRRLPDG